MKGESLLHAIRNYRAAELHLQRRKGMDGGRRRAAERLEEAERDLHDALHRLGVRRREPLFGRVLVAVDRGEASEQALACAALLAQLGNGRLALLHVVAPTPRYAGDIAVAADRAESGPMGTGAEILRHRQGQVPEAIETERILRQGRAAEEIVRAAVEWPADVVVIGHRPKTTLHRLAMRSISEQVVAAAPCPVLVVPFHAEHGMHEERTWTERLARGG